MKTVIIHDDQRGLLFKNGKFQKMLGAGKYRAFGRREIRVAGLNMPIMPECCRAETLLSHPDAARAVSVADVGDEQGVLHFVDGKFDNLYLRGKHLFWADAGEHTYRSVDMSTPDVPADLPRYVFSRIPPYMYQKIEVAEYQKARLYFDQQFVRILDAGVHYFWNTGVKIDVGYVDTRLTQMKVTGQEVLTADKVTLRINFVCNYRVTDYVRILTEIDDFAEQIHVAVQLALREYVGQYKLDEILANKEEMSAFVFGKLKEKQAALFVEFTEAGVKDIILPGEVRDIMNTVLLAEKRAQANVITRREEVASTRSLLNTAKLMEENPTLYKLKELEYVERICENVGTITLNGNTDVLSQLTGILKRA
ncbi:MAG: slipin family protein [Ruminococcaceae bacterium]|nr:slipin family protein [Oscillospiraceae bacterium]